MHAALVSSDSTLVEHVPAGPGHIALGYSVHRYLKLATAQCSHSHSHAPLASMRMRMLINVGGEMAHTWLLKIL